MTSLKRTFVLSMVVAGLLALPTAASSGPDLGAVSSFEYSHNMHPMGHHARASTGSRYNSDLAFWGKKAYQGHYDGFRILDISEPDNPQQIINYTDCRGDQGDVIIWDNILVRSWNTAAGNGATCDGDIVVNGFEGLHVFDVSDPTNPDLVAQVDLPCGSHTATGVPDLANNRLIVYNSASSGTCPWIDLVTIPLDDPMLSLPAGVAMTGRSCHDTSVILGDEMLASCAGGNGFTVLNISASLLAPVQLYSKQVPGVSIAHSHAFSWDGDTLVFGHEPGGGSAARCQASTPANEKTLFFFDSRTGTQLGTWVAERPQTNTENCTIHNFNVVPGSKRDVLVSGNYQMGIAVLDFTDPTNIKQIAYADPAPLSPQTLGGDWSSYWYNGRIYESDITRGLTVWNMSGSAVAGAKKTGHLNPQTQEFTIG